MVRAKFVAITLELATTIRALRTTGTWRRWRLTVRHSARSGSSRAAGGSRRARTTANLNANCSPPRSRQKLTKNVGLALLWTIDKLLLGRSETAKKLCPASANNFSIATIWCCRYLLLFILLIPSFPYYFVLIFWSLRLFELSWEINSWKHDVSLADLTWPIIAWEWNLERIVRYLWFWQAYTNGD